MDDTEAIIEIFKSLPQEEQAEALREILSEVHARVVQRMREILVLREIRKSP